MYFSTWKVMHSIGGATNNPILRMIYSGKPIPQWVMSVFGNG
jgi:hypothetical protein